jgi:hypothetical protein
MWLFNKLPLELLEAKYDFKPTQEWIDHVRLASVRFNVGGSASFVSESGLVITNHHVGADTLHKLSTEEHNYYRDGFYAKTQAEELKAPDLELNQLVSIEDVTERVNSAVKPDLPPAEAFQARQAEMARIEEESLKESGLRSDVVTLYGGGQYHLYRYKKYTDVRLVFAPEAAIAFFGGDPDNFEYPRYDLDVCLFRVYENDEPAKIEHYLKWSKNGAGDGDLVFVSGNPGRTQRIFTSAALTFQRDKRMPYLLDFLRRKEVALQQFGYNGQEAERRAHDELFGVQNSRKAYTGMLLGLQDPKFMEQKRASEESFLSKVKASEQLAGHAEAWKKIEETTEKRARLQGQTAAFDSQLFEIAQTIVFMATEDQKPSPERLREYRDSNRESLLQQLFSPAPIYDDLEKAKLGDSLARFAELRGGDHPLVQKALDGKAPFERAAELISGSELANVDYRKELSKASPEELAKSEDPMIRLARAMEPEARRLRKATDELDEIERQAYAQITAARFALEGESNYPDATFTLRLAFGVVKGYVENGEPIAPWTTMGGAFETEKRHGAEEPWQLPKSWHEHKDDLDLSTPFNFVCTADIIGGNSGSPVVNREGEFVGIIFDGNIQSLTADYAYSDEMGRAVSVHSSAIREALDKIYGAERIVKELQ